MQKAGDVCEDCRPRWEGQGMEPKVLQRLAGTTMNKKMIVPACEYCDGPALEVSAMGNQD